MTRVAASRTQDQVSNSRFTSLLRSVVCSLVFILLGVPHLEGAGSNRIARCDALDARILSDAASGCVCAACAHGGAGERERKGMGEMTEYKKEGGAQEKEEREEKDVETGQRKQNKKKPRTKKSKLRYSL